MTGDLDQYRREIRAEIEAARYSNVGRWILKHLDYDDADFCLIWPFYFQRGGYPKWDVTHVAVHRIMCAYRHGEPPTPDHHSAHSCGRGTQGCVNPMHVSWKTTGENQIDRYIHKPQAGRAVLTAAKVLDIRRRAHFEPTSDLAEEFGVSISTILGIKSGRTWKEVPMVPAPVGMNGVGHD